MQAEYQGSINPDRMSYEQLTRLQETNGSVSKELSEKLLSRLPSHKYKPVSLKGKGKSIDKDEECPICKMEYNNGYMLITLPCRHQ
ncbi:hypothetical protein RGQ29_030217 [Quercus rubra]|uniref:RING/U-box superfamily protein n=1 Tax=Quercus rubra TaxID=3512 RepID=A0AAN7IAC9_QUERU|nr:hypothetical protein RGQ29_030217 [Quercus rubra]